MKRLYILRHAQALPATVGQSDKDRKLSPNGVSDAKALGAAMQARDFTPSLVLCSPAVRTRETLHGVLEGFKEDGGISPATDFPEQFYNASPGDYLTGIQDVDDKHESVLVVGHNPGIHALAASLAEENDPSLMNRLAAGYAPATLTVLECDIESWAEIKPYENTLIVVLETIDYNAPERPTRWM